jgi:anhydro-N-acetylmuramic acid kinase
MLVLGIMSGTSVDSIDYALCSIDSAHIQIVSFWQVAIPRPIKLRIHRAASGLASSFDLSQLHHDLGRLYAAGALKGKPGAKPSLIGLHGQTVFHNPDKRMPSTFQAGEPVYLARGVSVPVVSNFRAADIAAGGQGAPLATLFHKQIFGKRGQHVCVNNLGGISNVTSIDWTKGRDPAILSFDTGPANVSMDLTVRHFTKGKSEYDRAGRLAASGKVHARLLEKWLKHAYFSKAPPKSTGRELFGEPFFKKALVAASQHCLGLNDLLATLAELTARSIILNYQRHLPTFPDAILLSGGGAANSFLVDRIRTAASSASPRTQVRTVEDLGWNLQSIEPAAFALLAWRRFKRLPGNIPATTGAREAVLCGQITEC